MLFNVYVYCKILDLDWCAVYKKKQSLYKDGSRVPISAVLIEKVLNWIFVKTHAHIISLSILMVFLS